MGLIKEIVGHAWVLDRKRTPNLDRTEPPSLSGWRLLLITEIKTRGDRVELNAEFLETVHRHRITLVTKPVYKFYVGQFASLCHNVLSFFDEVTGERQELGVIYNGMQYPQTNAHDQRQSTGVHRKLDDFGLPFELKTEGVPSPNERAHYIGRDPTSRYFENVKEIIQQSVKTGAQYLADFQIALNDRKVKTLLSSKWTRQLVSAMIYDIRNEDKLRTQNLPKTRTIAEAVHQLDREKTAKELEQIKSTIDQLEAAWDAAPSAGQRQKIHEQLVSARRTRNLLFGILWV